MKKNQIIYEPDFIINSQELLTSLCVYFDELILVSRDSLDKEEDKIMSTKAPGYQSKLAFIEHTLRPLLTEQVITLYDNNSILDRTPKSSNIDLGDIDVIQHNDEKVIVKINSLTNNKITRAIFEKQKHSSLTVGELLRLIDVYSLSMEYNIPVATLSSNQRIKNFNANSLAYSLALKTLCTFALPQLSAPTPDDIIDIRNNLKDELIEFKAGILDLTYLLYQTISTDSIKGLNQEMEFLIDTKIKSSVMSLEHKIATNKRKSFSNIILNGSKFILSGALMCCGLDNTANTLNNGLSTLQALSDLNNSLNNPEDKIASYILKFNNKLQH